MIFFRDIERVAGEETGYIEPAEHIKATEEYYFAKKLAEVASLNSEGRDVISLAVGAPDSMPSQETIDALCSSAQQSDAHTYQPYRGIPELRKAYSDWYRRIYNVGLRTDELLPLIGSKEGILHISITFLNVGDGVLVPNPGYPTYRSVAKLLRANPIEYDLIESNGWYPDFEALENMDLSKVKMIWVNYPNMPTGANATEQLFQRLIEFGKKHSIIICHDNPYSFILNRRPMSILSIPNAKNISIELNSLSKSHNMSGWRIGMLASNSQFVDWILRAKTNIDSGQFKPMQLAAISALSNSDEWHEEMNRIYAERRIWAEKILNLLNCRFDKLQSGLFVWGRLPDELPDSEEFVDKILYNARVFITPGSIFGSNGDRFIRISLGSSLEKLQEAFLRIKEYVG